MRARATDLCSGLCAARAHTRPHRHSRPCIALFTTQCAQLDRAECAVGIWAVTGAPATHRPRRPAGPDTYTCCMRPARAPRARPRRHFRATIALTVCSDEFVSSSFLNCRFIEFFFKGHRVRLCPFISSLRVIAISSRSMISLFLAFGRCFGGTSGCLCLRMTNSLGISALAAFVTCIAISCREKSLTSDCVCLLVDAPW